MIPALALTISAAALLLALWSAALAVAPRTRPDAHRLGTNLLEAALLVQVVGAAVGLARGHRPDEAFTFVAYAVTSLALLPILVNTLAASDEDWGGPRWPDILTAVACVAVAVVVLRMVSTWPAAGA